MDLTKLSLYRNVNNYVNPISVGGARGTGGANPFEAGSVSSVSNETGELRPKYGEFGAYAGAIKGLSNNPNDTVGAKFDTNRLGLYGF